MAQKYPVILRIFHWVMAFLILGMLIAGFIMSDMAPSDTKWMVYGLHKSIGITLLGLVILRMAIRLVSHTPKTPAVVRWYESMLEKIVFLGLYGLMIAIPLSGYMMSMAGGHGVSWFGHPLPDFIGKNIDLGKMAKEYHEILAYIIIALLGLHIVGFLKHYFIDKENLLKRIW